MNLEDFFRKHEISDELCLKISPMFKIVYCKANNIILSMGEHTQVINLILEGIVRGYYLDKEGNDVTKCFSKEGDWCCYYNFLQSGLSSFNIEALEDCTLAQIDVFQLKNMIEKNPSLQSIYTNLTQDAFIQVEERGASFQKMNAKERYLFFMQEYPDIMKRVKQEYISSYLGITPSSLSRIKRSL